MDSGISSNGSLMIYLAIMLMEMATIQILKRYFAQASLFMNSAFWIIEVITYNVQRIRLISNIKAKNLHVKEAFPVHVNSAV